MNKTIRVSKVGNIVINTNKVNSFNSFWYKNCYFSDFLENINISHYFDGVKYPRR